MKTQLRILFAVAGLVVEFGALVALLAVPLGTSPTGACCSASRREPSRPPAQNPLIAVEPPD